MIVCSYEHDLTQGGSDSLPVRTKQETVQTVVSVFTVCLGITFLWEVYYEM